MAMPLGCVLSAFDDLVLHAAVETGEVGAEACNADDQIRVVLRVGLGVLQGLGADAVELDVGAAEVAVALDQGDQGACAGRAFDHLRVDLHVEVVGAVTNGVDGFRAGLDEGGDAFGVGAGHCGNGTVGESHACLAAVGQCAHHGTEVVVVGQGIGVQRGALTEAVRPLCVVDGVYIAVETLHEGLDFGLVVAVLGSLVTHLTDFLVAFEVCLDGFQQLLHGELLGVEDQVLDGEQGVGGVNAGGHDRVDLRVAGAACFFAHALFDAAVVHGGAEDARHDLKAGHLAEVGVGTGDLEQVIELFLGGFVKFVKGLEGGRIAGFCTDFLFGNRAFAVVEHELDDLGEAGLVFLSDEAALAADAGGNAAVVAAVAGVFKGDAVGVLGKTGQSALDHDVVVEDLGLAGTAADALDNFLHVGFLQLRMVEQGQGGLNALHLNLGFQHQFFQLGGSVFTVGIHTADGHGLAGVAGQGQGVGVALVFTEFEVPDPLEFEQGQNLFAGQVAFVNVLLEEGIHILAVAARGDCAGHLLGGDAEVQEPEGLDGFTEVAGRMFGHAAADFSDFQQLGLGFRIRFFGSGLFDQIGVAMGMGDDCVEGDQHGAVQVDSVPVGQRGGALFKTLLDVFDEVAQTLVQNKAVIGDAGSGGNGHVLVIHAGLGVLLRVDAVFFLVHLVVLVDAGAALPELVGLFKEFLRFGGDFHFAERGHLGHLHFFLDPGNVPLGVGVNACADAGQGADDGVAIKENLFLGQYAFKKLGADIDNGFTLMLLVDIIHELQTLGVHDLGGGHEEILVFLDPRFSGIPVNAVALGGGIHFFFIDRRISRHFYLLLLLRIIFGVD